MGVAALDRHRLAAALRAGAVAAPTTPRARPCACCTSTCPSAWLAYLAFFVTVRSARCCYLVPQDPLAGVGPRRRRVGRDRRASSPGSPSATGMIWGRITWGVFWRWDARLTTTALLFLLFLGYLALRRLPAPPDGAGQAGRHPGHRGLHRRADRAHERRVVAHAPPEGHDPATRPRPRDRRARCCSACSSGVVAFTLVYLWLMLHKNRVADDGGRPRGPRARAGHRRAPGRGGAVVSAVVRCEHASLATSSACSG